MQKFKISVSKGGKRYSIFLNAVDEIQARNKVHEEGYSILNIETVVEDNIVGHKYIFEGEKEGKIKKGKILGDDIFKVYLKLRKDLGYNVNILYTETNKEIKTEEKVRIIKELEEEYDIYIGEKNKKKSEKNKEKIEKNKWENQDIENFYLKKDLEETYKLINSILEKMKSILSPNTNIDINEEEKESLKDIYNTIIKIKKTTNIYKLKEVGELGLLKIGELELKHLEKNKDPKTRDILKQTNKLLKKIGSKEHFIEKSKDIHFILSLFFSNLIQSAKSFFAKYHSVEKESKLDSSSYYYVRNEMLLRKYQDKKNLNTKEILKNLFSSTQRQKLFLRRRVINQNILLLLMKKKSASFSYSFIRKTYLKLFKKTLIIFKFIKHFLFYIIILYSFLFIIYINFYTIFGFFNIDYQGVLYFIILCILYFVLSFSKTFFGILLNFSLFIFFIIFSAVNF